MHALKLDLEEKNFLPPGMSYFICRGIVSYSDKLAPSSVRNAKLEQVKIYARKVEDAGPIYSKEVCGQPHPDTVWPLTKIPSGH